MLAYNQKLFIYTALDQIEELLRICPQMRIAQSLKVGALCNQHRWDDAKRYAEEAVLAAHPSVQALYSHPRAAFPTPSQSSLMWNVVNEGIEVDRHTIVNIMLCMGSDMAKAYLVCLKNLEVCSSYQNDSMEIIRQVLTILGNLIGCDPNWSWVQTSRSSVQELMDLILAADKTMHCGEWEECIRCYSMALKINPEAFLWNASLYYSRAKASLAVERYSEVVYDCQQILVRDPGNQLALLCRARANR